MAIEISLYAVTAASIVAASLWWAWVRVPRRAEVASYAVRGGTAVGALVGLTIGTAEAGLLGFYPIAILAFVIIWLGGFVVGALLSVGVLTARDMAGGL